MGIDLMHIVEGTVLRALAPGALFRLRERDGERCVYLTFDDGPIPEATPRVLDILDECGVKATFFMVGDNVRKHPEIAAEVRRRGHAVGSHTVHHVQGRKLSVRAYLREALRGAEMTGGRLFRPPHGLIKPRQARLLARRLRLVLFDVVSRDYSRRLDAARVLRRVQRLTRPGSIIVFHDSLRSLPRLAALPASIRWLQAQGYAFRTIPER